MGQNSTKAAIALEEQKRLTMQAQIDLEQSQGRIRLAELQEVNRLEEEKLKASVQLAKGQVIGAAVNAHAKRTEYDTSLAQLEKERALKARKDNEHAVQLMSNPATVAEGQAMAQAVRAMQPVLSGAQCRAAAEARPGISDADIKSWTDRFVTKADNADEDEAEDGSVIVAEAADIGAANSQNNQPAETSQQK
eukprot:TRINITY_DN13242_c0_g1_i1.p1 TRINITY_DN13242_c0_g1~~TRINITY_DN13242_c0_g1_i1.p1  ORF type:complete len:193 (+),score=34.42 TRINITY_DN13242_c0_g1_i1:24-602(+)